ncbi:hypothetical protein JVU11DRAFT_9509 [Chiua virens]|nr:hypothetical protein JVU11DRAFT_9509 [Chiua virens]
MMHPPPQLYAKHLLPYGYGYPLWTPEPSHELLMRRRDGLRIGDVGVIDLENGSFDVFFNICLPRDHPLHRATGVPDNFAPIQLEEWDIASYPHAEYPGRVISSSSVTAKTIEPTGEAALRPFTYDFNLSSSEGALLILPKGAESCKLRKRQLFKDIATRSANNWYNFAERHLGRIITHDSLYLITGLYKTRSWSVAAFHEATGTAESSAQFKASQAGEDNDMSYSWETMRALDWRVGPQFDVGIPNQSVFIIGFKIALREGLLGKKWVEVEVDSPSVQSRSVKFSNGGTGPRRPGNLWSRLLSRSGSSSTTSTKRTTRSTKDPKTTSSSTVQSDAGDTPHVTIDHVPQPLQSLHPSDVINRYMLIKESSASVAITHDTQWIILLEKGLLKPDDLGHNDRLERIISENYRLISEEGVVYLQAVWDSSIRLRDIDDAAHEAWKEDKLHDTEEILSRYIFRHTDSDYYAFASRALVRARLHNWDAALRDAETSIDIQPSVIAHVAKGFALFGKGKYKFAVEAFKIAFQQCDVDDRDIVSLIKFIVLFEVGYHAESMAGIADLVERCPIAVKPACSFVQAVMYVRQAASATKNKDHSNASQLLIRMRSLGQFHEVPDLKIITLICGWRFDNIPFTTRQQECEILLLVGRIDEAVELFRTMRRDLGEDVRTNKGDAEWIASFSQQCLKALESLGDSAMSSQNYNEAITRYSTAIGMGPIIREHFLTRRSKAYAAVHAWDDALRDADEAIDSNSLSLPGHESRHQALRGMSRYEESNQTFDRMVSIAMFKRSADMLTQYPRPPHGDPPQLTRETSSSRTSNPSHPPPIDPEHSSAIKPIAQVQDLDAQHPGQRLGESVRPQAELIGQTAGLVDQFGSAMTIDERDQVLRDHFSNILNTLLTSGEGNQGPGTMSIPPNAHRQTSNVVVEGVEEPALPQKPSGSAAILPDLLHDIHIQRSRRPPSSVDDGRPQSPSRVESQTSSSRSSSESDHESARVPHTGPMIEIDSPPAHPPTTMPRLWNLNGESSVDSLTTSLDRERLEDMDRRPPARIYLPPLMFSRPIIPPSVGMNVHVPPPPGVFAQPLMYPMMPPAPFMTQSQVPLHDVLIEILREQRHAHRASIDQQEELARHIRSMSEWMMREMQDRLSELRGMTSRMYAYPPRPGELGFMHTQPYHSVSTSGPGAPPFGQPWSAQWPPQPPLFNATPFYPIPSNATPFSATPHGTNPFGPSPFSTMPFGPTSHVSNSFGVPPFNATPFSGAPHPGPVNPPGSTPFNGTPFTVSPFVPSEPSPHFTSPPPGSRPITPRPAGNSEHVLSPASGSSSPPMVTIQPPSGPPTPTWVSNPTSTPSQALAAPIAISALAGNSLLLRLERESPVSEVATLVQSPTSTASPLSTLSTRIGVSEDDNSKKLIKFGTGDEANAKLPSKLGGKRRLGSVTFGEVTYI